MRISSLLLLFSVQITLANSALTEMVYDSSKTYSKGDAVIPSVTEFTLYTAKTSVPAGQNGPPNSTYWQTAEEYSTELQNTYSDTVSTPPSSGNISTSDISDLDSPADSQNTDSQSQQVNESSNSGGVVNDLVYDSTKSYNQGDAVIPSTNDFTLYTAKSAVPAGQNEPPNSTYWQTAEEYSTELQNIYSGTTSTPPSSENINTSEISNLGTPQNSNQKKTLTLIADTGGSVSGAGDYDINQSVMVTATPGDGYLFASWAGDFSSTDASISIVMKANYSLTASFREDTGDTDGDSLTNYQEAVVYKTSSNNVDSDGDGIQDGEEVGIGSNPAVSDAGLILYFNKQLSTEKVSSYNLGYFDGKVAGQMEVIDEIIKIITAIASANSLNVPEELKTYTSTDFFSVIGTLNLATIQLAIEQFIDYSDIELSPYTDGWFYTPNQGWLWTSRDAYPYFFKTGIGWIYFKRGYNLPQFYNFLAKQWFSFKQGSYGETAIPQN